MKIKLFCSSLEMSNRIVLHSGLYINAILLGLVAPPGSTEMVYCVSWYLMYFVQLYLRRIVLVFKLFYMTCIVVLLVVTLVPRKY